MHTIWNNKTIRLIASILIALLLGLMVTANKNNWFSPSEAIVATATEIDCPQLETGCSFNLDGKPIIVKSDRALEAGVPFTLDVAGDISAARAVWRMLKMDMGPNNYTLQQREPQHWQAQVTLPACPHGGKSWQLHLELGTQAANINTLIHDSGADQRRKNMHKKM